MINCVFWVVFFCIQVHEIQGVVRRKMMMMRHGVIPSEAMVQMIGLKSMTDCWYFNIIQLLWGFRDKTTIENKTYKTTDWRINQEYISARHQVLLSINIRQYYQEFVQLYLTQVRDNIFQQSRPIWQYNWRDLPEPNIVEILYPHAIYHPLKMSLEQAFAMIDSGWKPENIPNTTGLKPLLKSLVQQVRQLFVYHLHLDLYERCLQLLHERGLYWCNVSHILCTTTSSQQEIAQLLQETQLYLQKPPLVLYKNSIPSRLTSYTLPHSAQSSELQSQSQSQSQSRSHSHSQVSSSSESESSESHSQVSSSLSSSINKTPSTHSWSDLPAIPPQPPTRTKFINHSRKSKFTQIVIDSDDDDDDDDDDTKTQTQTAFSQPLPVQLPLTSLPRVPSVVSFKHTSTLPPPSPALINLYHEILAKTRNSSPGGKRKSDSVHIEQRPVKRQTSNKSHANSPSTLSTSDSANSLGKSSHTQFVTNNQHTLPSTNHPTNITHNKSAHKKLQ
jgi:hypothetical protein